MSNVSYEVLSTVNRLIVTFHNGTDKTVFGTGFWITDGNRYVFVTNRHTLDPQMLFGPDTDYVLCHISIELRKRSHILDKQPAKLFRIKNVDACLHKMGFCDLAVFCDPIFEDFDFGYAPYSILHSTLADQSFFQSSMQLTDSVFFIGFPGVNNSPMWDTQNQLPIARTATLASVPSIPYYNDKIPAVSLFSQPELVLVDGRSFSGSSGSPVVSLEKTDVSGAQGTLSQHTPSKIIGIMAGHWQLPAEDDKYRHSGLSYFVRSSAIRIALEGLGWSFT